MNKKWLLLLLLSLCFVTTACDLDPSGRKNVPPLVTPVTTPEFRCIIQEQFKDRSKLDKGTLSIITSVKVRQYMKDHCAKGPDGLTTDFKVYTTGENIDGRWLKVVQGKPAVSYPWFWCSDGAHGTMGPLPTGDNAVNDFLTAVKPYAEH